MVTRVQYKRRKDFADKNHCDSSRNIKSVMFGLFVSCVIGLLTNNDLMIVLVVFVVGGLSLLLLSKLHGHKLTLKQKMWVANLSDDEIRELLKSVQVKQSEKDNLIDLLRHLKRSV